ncbi:hypothetical protein BSL78_07720 [Apostichopus japonicus]|uniref:Uncharacterized protein n=1 Tax=Stichopus japonicus TaxID=307972 RepID=A0A2G8L5E1_STIJA|nr:hypothetical protein BSL78_07720 [Apostichopus japonicus]
MKKGSKNSPQRLTMSEPKKGKKAGNKGVSAKKPQSKTAQKMKPTEAKSGAADLEEKPISMKLFQEETAVVTRSSKKKAQKKPQSSTPKAAEKMPQADLDSSSQGDTTVNGLEQRVDKESNVSAKKKRTKRGRTPSQKKTATSTPESDHPNGKSLDSSLDSTLPIEADVRKTKKGKRKAEEEGDGVVSFPTTPALQIPSKKRKGELNTPAVTVKTPMPVGDDEWLSSSEATDGSAGEDISPVKSKKSDEKQVKQSGGKKLSAKERREKAKLRCPHILKCMNIPRGTKAAYLSLFFSEMDLNPQIKIKKLRQGGARARTKGH